MTWLDAIVGDMLKNLPPDAFSDRSGGLDDVVRVIALLEKAIEENARATSDARDAALAKALADPFHSFARNPIFAPAGVEQRKAEMTFPRIMRSSLLIAIYSHTEYLLLSWCESISKDPAVTQKFGAFKRNADESYPHHYLRYLRDGATIPLGDFEKWPEWAPLDAYRLARNCLAHNGGIVENVAHTAKISALPNIMIDDSGLQISEPIVHLLPGACEAAVVTAKAFIERLLTSAGL